jgi:ABC-type enterochelin transport system substrate-binding protein
LKVIIAGGRDFKNYELLKEKCQKILANQKEVIIISGGANGADKLGEQYAQEYGHKVEKFLADWDKFGKSAGYIRNKEMADNADALIAFWDGVSKGTKHMIDLAKEKELKIRVIKY